MGVSSNVKKIRYRAPRYTLRPYDAKGMRFSRKRKGAKIFETQIINVSETGMAFRVESENAPQIGEVIKVEFNVPGERYKIAWFANVVWLETPYHVALRKKEEVKAGIQFHSLPERHRQILSAGLKAKFNEVYLEARRRKILAFFQSLPEAALYLAIIGVVAGLIYYVSQQTPEKDPDRQNAWGERFFKNVIKEPGQ
jgi:hypothetical protein